MTLEQSGALVDRHDLVMFDLDGVVYLGTEPVPGAVEGIGELRRRGVGVAYVTNNASRSAAQVSALLNTLGVPAEPAEVITSAQATAELLAQRLPAGSTVLVVGSAALVAEVAAVGLRPVSSAADGPVAVVQGYGPEVGWALLAEACVAVRSGATWVATNPDRTLPSPRGPLPGNGALVAAVATALDRQPDLIVGKPEPMLFQQAAARHGGRRPLVVGDRLDTDIEGACRAGMESLLVLTGVSRPAELLTAPPNRRPTYVAADLYGLFTVDDAGSAWKVSEPESGVLQLAGHGDPVAALRALCAVTWAGAGVDAPVVRPVGAPAESALRALELSA